MMSVAASLGLSLLWDTDVGLSHIDKYTYSSEEYSIKACQDPSTYCQLISFFKAGALLATGLLNTGVRTKADAAFALLGDFVGNKSVLLKISAITGLGLAYVGSHREDLLSPLLPLIADDGVSMKIASLSALALGFVFVGSANGEVASTILQTLMEREDKALNEKWGRFMVLGLGLLYLGMLTHCCDGLNLVLTSFGRHQGYKTLTPRMRPLRR
jgi:26S proteasome regulatory subunit N1